MLGKKKKNLDNVEKKYPFATFKLIGRWTGNIINDGRPHGAEANTCRGSLYQGGVGLYICGQTKGSYYMPYEGSASQDDTGSWKEPTLNDIDDRTGLNCDARIVMQKKLNDIVI